MRLLVTYKHPVRGKIMIQCHTIKIVSKGSILQCINEWNEIESIVETDSIIDIRKKFRD